MELKFKGKVHKYGSNIDTDIIIPARYLTVNEPAELAQHCMEPVDPDFPKRVQPGDMIVADANFGCGSSREHAPLSIKAAGIGCIIAKSFARIFYRNSINIGLAVLECPEAVDGIKAGDEVEADITTGVIKNLTTGQSFQALPYPEFMLGIVQAGGLVNYTRQKLAAQRA